MGKVNIEDQGEIGIIRLDNGPTNAISVELVSDLLGKINEARNGFKGIVLAGNAKFFSIGLDLPSLLPLNRKEMTDFWHQFNRAALDLYTLPVPTVCAIKGHAVAGGTILAITGDFRVAAEGKIKFGLNEVKLGVPVPFISDMILRDIVGDRAATRMLYFGDLMGVSEAAQMGLVDAVYSQETVENEAVALAMKLAGLPSAAFSVIKANRVEAIRLRYENDRNSKHDLFLDCWFSDSTRELLKKASEAF